MAKKKWQTNTVSSKDADADAAKWDAEAADLEFDSIGFAPESNPGPFPRDGSVDSTAETEADAARYKAGNTSESMKQSAPKVSKPKAKASKPKRVAAKPSPEPAEPY
jgi:hypothetical protein